MYLQLLLLLGHDVLADARHGQHEADEQHHRHVVVDEMNVLVVAMWPVWKHLHERFPQIDIIGAVVIVWRERGKIIRSVLCSIVCNKCTQCDAHTYEQT